MTRPEQVEFVQELMLNIMEDVVERVRSGSVPEVWDGLELRQYLADTFARSTVRLTSKRQMAYDNELMTNSNLRR